MACLLSARKRADKITQDLPHAHGSGHWPLPAGCCPRELARGQSRGRGHAHRQVGLVAPRDASMGLPVVPSLCRAPAWGPGEHPTPPTGPHGVGKRGVQGPTLFASIAPHGRVAQDLAYLINGWDFFFFFAKPAAAVEPEPWQDAALVGHSSGHGR